MADITIQSDVLGAERLGAQNRGPVWANLLKGYFFYINTSNQAVFTRTEDSGKTWSAPTLIKSATFILGLCVWADWWTPGDTGVLIHIAVTTNIPDDTSYYNLNINTDVLSSGVIVRTFATGAGSLSQDTTITKSRAGNLHIAVRFDVTAGDHFHRRSTDGGATWSADLTSPIVTGNDYIYAYPANLADPADLYFVLWRTAANDLQLKHYDDSANTIPTTTTIDSGLVDTSGTPNYGAFVRPSDSHLFIFVGDGFNSSNAIRGYRISDVSTVAFLTNVVTGVALLGVQPSFAERTNTIYVAYARDLSPTGQVYYKTSIDGGITWSSEIQFSVTAGTHVVPGADSVITQRRGGRFMPSWTASTDGDVGRTNFDNSIEFAGDIQVPIVPDPPIGTPESPAPGPALEGGSISYIGPDGQVYPLVTPHLPVGRFVMNFSGFGMPPFDYVTQRGPFQHGETVRDFFARPRIVQLLIRHQFQGRQEWWDGRNELLDNLRPNRQTTPTGTTPGILRFIRTDGSRRQLDVFIEEGPRFEPSAPDEWDEWAFQEILRFIAHNPIAYDPTQQTLSFAIVLDAELVFPITFPIEFGGGDVSITSDITYLGTWEEFPIILITGPLESPRIDNLTTGEFIALDFDMAPGQTVTINLRPGFKTVTDNTGANLIGTVTPGSNLATFHIAPDPEAPNGVNQMRLTGQHPTAATLVSIQYLIRYVGF